MGSTTHEVRLVHHPCRHPISQSLGIPEPNVHPNQVLGTAQNPGLFSPLVSHSDATQTAANTRSSQKDAEVWHTGVINIKAKTLNCEANRARKSKHNAHHPCKKPLQQDITEPRISGHHVHNPTHKKFLRVQSNVSSAKLFPEMETHVLVTVWGVYSVPFTENN